MENHEGSKGTLAARTNKFMLLIDTLMFVTVLVLLLASKNKKCEANLGDFMLTYLIFKGIFCVFRAVIWVIDEKVSEVGTNCWTCYLILWIPAMGTYYVLQLVDFFRSDTKDCYDRVKVKWAGALIITIEGIICLCLILGLIVALGVWIAWLVIKTCKDNSNVKVEKKKQKPKKYHAQISAQSVISTPSQRNCIP
ncbi:unnamed protein product [Moneuplotes crassus]|uniref:Transmembrane protein n=1 Tax=Euplotes crassus TaxID=5936 RepID=A0AAD2D6Y6_EUPCR|nr:unnamed protein product [Moneuplotes crassus]